LGSSEQTTKKTETDDKERLFSERYYGRFERRIPLPDIDQDKIDALFKNGVLNVTVPNQASSERSALRLASSCSQGGLRGHQS